MHETRTAYPDDARQNRQDQRNPPLLQNQALRGDIDHALHNKGGGTTGAVGCSRPARKYDSPLAPCGGRDVIGRWDAPEPHWDAPLPVRLRIASADNLEIRTLRDAGDLVSGRHFTPAHSAALQDCAELLVRAARSGSPDHVAAAALHLQRILRVMELA